MRPNIRLMLIPFWIGAVITPFIMVIHSSHYFLNTYAFGSFLTSYFVGALGIVIAYKGFDSGERWQLFLLSLCFFLWLWLTSMGYLCKPAESALAVSWYKAGLIPVIFIAAQIYSFTCSFLKLKRPRIVFAGYFIAVIFTLLNIFTPYFFGEVYRYNWGLYPHWHFIRVIPFFMYFSAGLILSQIELLKAYKHSEHQRTKNQIKYMVVAYGIAYLGIIDYLPCFGYNVYPFGYVAIFGWWTILAYAILKHRLMDITIIIRKTVIYSMVTGVLAAIMVLVAMLSANFTQGALGHKTFFALAVATCLITAIFHPLQLKVQAFVDRHLFHDWADREVVREVASGFSHELKSPLAGLSMQAQLALANLEDFEKEHPSMRKELTKLKDELHYILNKAMDAAQRIEAVRGVAEPTRGPLEPVRVSDLMDSSLVFLQSLVGQTKVSVRRDLPETLPCIYGDAKQLEIVFINLMKNAIEAMDKAETGNRRTGESALLVLSGSEKNGLVLISVKDSGEGIAAKDLDRIFELNFTTKGSRGTGMGLYLTQQIVKSHGGTIEVKSEIGKGTEFIVRLPRFVEKGSAAA